MTVLDAHIASRRLHEAFSELSTPLIADACLRLGVSFRVAPVGIRPLVPGSHIAGRVLPVRHHGSVDIFFEALENAEPGDVLTVDNGGRIDQSCIGDLIALEAKICGLAGIVAWGLHRDTAELHRIGLPVFSYGTCPAGPLRLEPRDPEALSSARFGSFRVGNEDHVFADDDGVLFLTGHNIEKLLATAYTIWQTERKQVEAMKAGTRLRDQLRFQEYVTRRVADPSYTFRKHLRQLNGAIEE